MQPKASHFRKAALQGGEAHGSALCRDMVLLPKVLAFSQIAFVTANKLIQLTRYSEPCNHLPDSNIIQSRQPTSYNRQQLALYLYL